MNTVINSDKHDLLQTGTFKLIKYKVK